MASLKRSMPLLRLLARLGWERDPERWTVQCRDERGRRASLRVGVSSGGVTFTPSVPGELVVAPLQAGHLRAAVRAAVEILEVRRPLEDSRFVRDQPELALDAPYHAKRRDRYPPSPLPRVRVALSPKASGRGAPAVPRHRYRRTGVSGHEGLPVAQPRRPCADDGPEPATGHVRRVA